MPLAVTILNKQRRISVALPHLQAIVEPLAACAMAELELSAPGWLPGAVLAECEARGSLSVVLVSNRRIREINREWRGQDSVTDVLSFPLVVQDDHSVEISLCSGDEALELGELIISLEKAAQQAEEYGHKFEREFAFLFVHGLLHVLGFDHLTKAQERDMFGRQALILERAGFPR